MLFLSVAELGPYVFQVLAYMLELRGTGTQQAYVALLPSLLMPILWQRVGYQPPLVRLLQAYLNNAPQLILAQGHLQPILGVFQKLLSSAQSDHLAFYLLESIFLSLPFDQVQPFVPNIFTLIFARIQSSKTTKIMRSFIVFLAFFIGKHGASTVLQAIDAVQPKLFMMVMESLWLAHIQKVSGLTERKACAIAMIKLLTDCPALLGEVYFPLWSKILAALMAVLELPQQEAGTTHNIHGKKRHNIVKWVAHNVLSFPAAATEAADEEVDVDIAQASHASFETLMHARKKDVDPFKDVDPKKLLAFSLQRLSQAHPGKVRIPPLFSHSPPTPKTASDRLLSPSKHQFGALVQQSLAPEALTALQGYFVAAGLNQPYLA
jgi:exportin-2 (importin alpha re-exporter)